MLEAVVSVVILAAGASSRMGIPKWQLLWDEQETFLAKILREYQHFGCQEIALVVNEATAAQENFPNGPYSLVVNHHIEWGRFHSVQLGLGELSEPGFCFVQDIDHPFVEASVLSALAEHKSNQGYVVPTFQSQGGHPILLGQEVIEAIVQTTEAQAVLREVLQLFPRFQVAMPDDRVLLNINTPELYQAHFPSLGPRFFPI